MSARSPQRKREEDVLSSLNTAIDALNHAKGATNMRSAKVAFTSASVLLTVIRDSMISKVDYVELGMTCSNVCEALNRGMETRPEDQLGKSVLQAIEKLKTTMTEIQKHIVERGKRNALSRRYHAKDDKEAIATWGLEFNRILHVFHTELWTNVRTTDSGIHQGVKSKHTVIPDAHRGTPNAETTVSYARHDVSYVHPIVSDTRGDVAITRTTVSAIHHDKLKGRENADAQNQAPHASAPGKLPPPQRRNTRGTTSDIRRDVSEVQTMVSDIRHMLKTQEGADGRRQSTQSSVPGELPPPPPRVFFGRDDLIERIVDFTKRLTPIALIGAGGIGKTSIILTVLHEDRIKRRFGNNRWFIRCDEFPASRPNFLRRLSEVIGAGVENPEDLTSLRRYLSSREMLIILDNAESVLDLQEPSTQDVYTVVDELTRFNNVCICITSRISTIPPDCEIIEIPTLSINAARDTFCRIYKHDQQSGPIDDILRQLDFHPLSVNLLATVAQHNKWDTDRITREWERQRTGVLRIQPSRSFATTIELSLTSPMFRELGPDARGLLGAIAFFPQGVNEENVEWLFPTISDGSSTLDKFCILSLTYRANGFVTMLAPLRDYLRPKDPMTSPLLLTTKERYFARLSTSVFPGEPGFEGSRWIASEDVNVEYLLDVFTSIDAGSEDVWSACSGFMTHLYWYKPRLIKLGPKIEALPDNHPSKPEYLWDLSWLFDSVGNLVERKRLLTYGLKLGREREDDHWVAKILGDLSDANRQMGLPGEGIPQAKEASEIFEQLGYTARQADSLIYLAWLLHDDDQFDAAEEPVSRAINLLPEEGEEHLACQAHRLLGKVYGSKGDLERGIHHSKISLRLAISLNATHELFWIHHSLADLYSDEGKFDDAHAHLEHAKSHAVNNVYLLANASWMEAWCLKEQRMLEEARSEALSALRAFETLGATTNVEHVEQLLEEIDGLLPNEDNPGAPDRVSESE